MSNEGAWCANKDLYHSGATGFLYVWVLSKRPRTQKGQSKHRFPGAEALRTPPLTVLLK